jgi:hypothetical protein
MGAAVVSSSAEFLICLGVLAALWVSYVVPTVRQERRRPRFGPADAYEGNLIVPPPGRGHHGRSSGHGTGVSGHGRHGGGTGGHGAGHGGHGDGIGGHSAGGFGHH